MNVGDHRWVQWSPTMQRVVSEAIVKPRNGAIFRGLRDIKCAFKETGVSCTCIVF